jgi:hypothetical protein
VRIGPLRQRRGKIIVTPHTVRKMAQYQVDGETLENAFRFGAEYRAGKIIHKYARHTIGLYYKVGNPSVRKNKQAEKLYVVTTCWKGR